MEKLYPAVCSVVPAVCKPKAVGQGIAIWAKVEQKGRMIFLYWEIIYHKWTSLVGEITKK